MARLSNPYSKRVKSNDSLQRAIVLLFVCLVVTWCAVTWKYINGDMTNVGMPPVPTVSERKSVDHLTTASDTSSSSSSGLKGSSEENKRKGNDNKDNNNNKDNKKKRGKHDYRTFHIETPPPKQKHERVNFNDQIANLTKIHPVFEGREKLVHMLLEMYIDVEQIDEKVWAQVPVWDDIVKIHGSGPVIYGLDQCEDYRNRVAPIDRRVGVAGMFNTGTNLLAILLQHNCAIPERVAKWGRKKGHGMEWQVPWGKHTPAWYRKKAHVKNFIGQIPEDDLMVAVMVRHPHDWIKSMCRHCYTAKWIHKKDNCPNLYDGNTVHAKFGPGPSDHASIAHMWNDWNGVYHNATFPRLLVRFEDTVFFPKEVSRRVCSCVGGKLMTPKERDGLFHYVIDSAKTGPGHGPGAKRNGLLDAWIKYGKPRDYTPFRPSDLEFIEQHIDHQIMSDLGWQGPPPHLTLSS